MMLAPSRLCLRSQSPNPSNALSCSNHSQDQLSRNTSVHFLAQTTLKTALRQIQAFTFLLKPLSRQLVAKYKHALSCSNHSQDYSFSNTSVHFLAQTTLKTTRREIQAFTFLLKPLSRPLVTKYKHALSQDHSSPNRSVHFLPLTTLKTTLRQIQACTFLLKPLPRLPVAKYKHALSFSNHSQDHSSPNTSMHSLKTTRRQIEAFTFSL